MVEISDVDHADMLSNEASDAAAAARYAREQREYLMRCRLYNALETKTLLHVEDDISKMGTAFAGEYIKLDRKSERKAMRAAIRKILADLNAAVWLEVLGNETEDAE